MKKCPTCGKEFEDSMRFCQVDGAELVNAEPTFDPYATMVGHKLDLTKEKSAETSAEETPPEVVEVAPAVVEESVETPATQAVETAEIHETTGSIPIAAPDEVLDLPGVDPLKTMFVSEAELKEALGTDQPPPEPSAKEPILSVPEMAPPPSPFSVPESPAEMSVPALQRFADAEPSAPTASAQFGDPFPAPAAEWTPPPAPDVAWQNQEIGSNTPFQPPPVGAGGQSQGLALGSLICGILSCTVFCCMGIFLGPIAIILGFIAKKKADENPSEYGGRGLALGGMITGAVGVLFGIGFIIYEVLMGGLALLLQGMSR